MLRPLLVVAVLAATAHADGERAASPTGDNAALRALLARTDDIAKEVAHVRGLRLKHQIPNEVVDRTELRKRLVELAGDHETAEQSRVEGLDMKRWGMVPLDYDYTGALVDLMTDQIAGYYDGKTKKMTILDTVTDPEWAEMVLAHELDHGLQDQAFDLEKFEKLPDSETDASYARHALVEGDGVATMIEVLLARDPRAKGVNPWADAGAAREVIDAMTTPNGDSLDSAPLAIREAMVFPYREGFAFVAALRRHAAWTAVDAAFRRPPKSTEQILHVEKYLADEPPVAITATAPAALPGYALARTATWGELGVLLFLRSHGIATQVARDAAAGWGGDRSILLARADETNAVRTVGITRTEWDTEADASEAQAALGRALDDAVVGATIEHGPDRTRWLALDGTVAWLERRGTSIVFAIGAPAYGADALEAEAWTDLVPQPKRQAKR